VLPLVLLAVLNSRLTMAYRVISNRRARMMSHRTTASGGTTDQENNITLIMIIVVLIFMLTQAPARLVQILWEYKSIECNNIQFVLIEISKLLEVLNSSTNFFIYCGIRAKFREALWSWMCNLKPGEHRKYRFILLHRKQSQWTNNDEVDETHV